MILLIFLGVPAERFYLGDYASGSMMLAALAVFCFIPLMMLCSHATCDKGINSRWAPKCCIRQFEKPRRSARNGRSQGTNRGCWLPFNVCAYLISFSMLCGYITWAVNDFMMLMGHTMKDFDGCPLDAY
jgi:hypothetical protein